MVKGRQAVSGKQSREIRQESKSQDERIEDLRNRKADIRQHSRNTVARGHDRQYVRKQQLKGRHGLSLYTRS